MNTETYKVNQNDLLLVEEALECYLNKAFIIKSSFKSLSEGMPFLLELVSNNTNLMIEVQEKYKCSAELIRSAVIAFMKEAYFKHTDNPYRLLGLSPWANSEDAKKRYRFLIRLFHPDRGLTELIDDMDFSSNINHAYSLISNKSKNVSNKSFDSSSNFYPKNEDHFDEGIVKHNVQIHLVFLNVFHYLKKLFKSSVKFLWLYGQVICNFLSRLFKLILNLLKSTIEINLWSLSKLKLIASASYKLIFSTFFNIKKYHLKATRSLLPWVTSVVIVFASVAAYDLVGNQKIASLIENYFTNESELFERELSEQLALREESLRKEALRKEEQAKVIAQRREAEQAEQSRQLALKQEQAQKKAERIAMEQAKLSEQLALREESLRKEALRKEEQARVNAQRREAEQAEQSRQLALKQEQARQKINHSGAKSSQDDRELSLQFTRVLIDIDNK